VSAGFFHNGIPQKKRWNEMHEKVESNPSIQLNAAAPRTPTFDDSHACRHNERSESAGGAGMEKTRHGIWRRRILILTVVFVGALLAPGEFLGEALNSKTEPLVSQNRQDDTDSAALKMSRRRVKYNACVQSGKHECFRKMQAAVDWCMKNRDECRPLLESGRMSVQAYGDQVGEKCMRDQEQKCRQEYGL
jgi:hypothetical protein